MSQKNINKNEELLPNEVEQSVENTEMPLLTKISKWSTSLIYENIPDDVIQEAKLQIKNIIAAMFYGSKSKTVARIIDAGDELMEENPHLLGKVYPSGKKYYVTKAAFINACQSMVYDFDDYLFAGHTGHSAVIVPLALSEITDISGMDFLVAQIIANELGGRLGGSALIGPLNGQLWSFVHLIGGAAAGSKLIGLNDTETKNAISLALSQPTFPSYSGFMGGYGKVLTAAKPIRAAIESIFFAKQGLSGTSDIIEAEEGFWKYFSFSPIPEMFTGLSNTWLTKTLSYKPYPGCAYITTFVDAILELKKEHEINPEDISEINIITNALTYRMNELSLPYIERKSLGHIPVNFNISKNAAIAVKHGNLTVDLLQNSVDDPEIKTIADKVNIKHNYHFTRRTLSSSSLLDINKIIRKNAGKSYKYIKGQLKDTGVIRELLKGVGGGKYKKMLESTDEIVFNPALSLNEVDLSSYKIAFPSFVQIIMKDGTVLEKLREYPSGGAGSSYDERKQIVDEKLNKALSSTLDAKSVKLVIEMIDKIEELDFKELGRLKSNLIE